MSEFSISELNEWIFFCIWALLRCMKFEDKETKGSPNLYVVSILFISVVPKYSGN